MTCLYGAGPPISIFIYRGTQTEGVKTYRAVLNPEQWGSGRSGRRWREKAKKDEKDGRKKVEIKHNGIEMMGAQVEAEICRGRVISDI